MSSLTRNIDVVRTQVLEFQLKVTQMQTTNKTTSPKLRVVDLFAGCGGMSLGFQKSGFEVIAAFENWKPAVEVYKANFRHPVFEMDLSSKSAPGEVAKLGADIIIGGPPCQDFSSAGHRNEDLGRADLTIHFAKIVSKSKPRAFVMENVPNARKSSALAQAKEIFIKAGYGLSEAVLDASYCGVPQKRKRYFLIGIAKGKNGEMDELLSAKLSTEPMTLRDYFGDSLGFEHYFRVPRSYSRRGVFSIDEPASTVRGVDRPVPKGYPGHPRDTAPINGSIRTMTFHERAMVQTFPKTFKIPAVKTAANEMIGNAVPVNLAKHVANALLTRLNLEL